jgi:CheY-like chemotaxis protein
VSPNAPRKSSLAIHTLVVVDDMLLQAAIERRVKQAGHVASSASSAREAIERLRRELFDVVLCDLHASAGDGTELLQWLGSYYPSLPVVVIVEALNPEFRGQYDGGGSVRIVEKPVDLDKLVGMVEACGPRKGFFGNQIEVEFFDYVQMIAVSGRDKAIIVNTHGGTGYIWFEHGDIVHAQWGDHRGEQAFYKILATSRGSFREVLFRAPPARTIVRPSMHLLMEAVRQQDEGTLGDSETVEEREDEKSGKHVAAPAPEPTPQPTPPPRVEPKPEPRVEARAPEPRPSDSRSDLRTRAPMPKPVATTPAKPAPASQPPARRPEQQLDASFADSAIARIDDISMPQDDDELEAHGRGSASTSRGNTPPVDDGVPIARRRVQTLNRVIERSTPVSTPAIPSRHTPTSVPALRATPASVPARATPASTPAVSRGTPTSMPAVRPSVGPAAAARTTPGPGRHDRPPIKKANTVDLLEDPETRELMLGQFWQFEGVNGVAIISSTGKVIAEDMRNNSTVVTLAGFYMRGAARIARTLGYHVFDGVIARSTNGQQMIMVGMGATSAVLSVAPGHDPEAIRDAIMGVDTKR